MTNVRSWFRWRRPGKAAAVWLSVAVMLAAAMMYRNEPRLLVELRESLFDTYQRLRPRPYRPAPVRIVDIDEASLARLGQWPWPRTLLAALLDRLREMNAAAVVLDLLIAEPDRTSPAALFPAWQASDPELDQWIHRLPDHDEALVAALTRNRVITGFAVLDAGDTGLPVRKAGFAYAGAGPPAALPWAAGAVTALPAIETAATGNGALSVSLAAGGVIRVLPLFWRIDGQTFPSLVAEALRVAQAADTYVLRTADPGARMTSAQIGAYAVPTDASGHLWLYASRPVPERYIPAWRILDGTAPADALRGKIALIGSTARGLEDVHRNALGYDVPGIDFHAQALEQIIDGAHLTRPDWAEGGEIMLLLALGTFVLLLGPRLGPTWTAAVGGAAVVASFAVSWGAFTGLGLLLDPLYPAMAVIAVYFTFSLMRHLQTERQQRWIRKAFASYISPRLVNELVDHPEQLKLGGERRNLSFVFTDLAGFTSFVERNPPAVVVPVLNAYLDGMIRVVFAHDGTLDKIIGDAVHVMFGAPLADERHADRAVACALAIDRFAREFTERQRTEGVVFGHTRVGVNSGFAIVGNFGGELRFDYTAHGDVINTAARLEEANKYLGTRICVSEHTVALCQGFFGRPIGTLLLRGKADPIRVFEALDPERAAADAREAYGRAFERLEAGAADAASLLTAYLARWPEDPLAAFHLARLRAGEQGAVIRLAATAGEKTPPMPRPDVAATTPPNDAATA